MKKVVFAVVLLLSASIAYADGQGSSKIIGSWVEVNGRDRIEFKADGTCSGIVKYGYDRALRQITGTYVSDGNTVRITIYNTAPMILKVKTTPTGLNVTYVDGGPVKVDNTTAVFLHK
jgi:hypothetical protein